MVRSSNVSAWRFSLLFQVVLFLALVSAPGRAQQGSGAATSAPDRAARAGEAYEAGNCREVLELLAAQPEGATALDGISLYRRGFCRALERQSGAEDDYSAAATRLADAANRDGASLDEHFYLVNALENLQRDDEAKAAAARAVDRWKKGALVVPAEVPDDWFRLGKLFRDAGDAAGAASQFKRALDLAPPGSAAMRRPYVERIARWAGEDGDGALAGRAAEWLGGGAAPIGGGDLLALGRAEIAAGRLQAARDAFVKARSAGGDIGMAAQYSMGCVDRALEVARWNMEPATATDDGRALSDLAVGELQQQIMDVISATRPLFDGEIVIVPRKHGEGTRPAPAPEVKLQLRAQQARLAGLLLEAARRGVPLREWAISGGFAPMTHFSLPRLFVQQAEKRLAEEDADPLATSDQEP